MRSGVPAGGYERPKAFAALLETEHALADISAAVALRHFRRPMAVDDKARDGAPFDPVTPADRGAETAIRRYLRRHHPDHAILGEEHGADDGVSAGRLKWVIDPIDGTKAFIMGSPLWGTLIGLVDGSAPLLGIMNQPYTRERVWSARTSSYWRGTDGKVRRISTRTCCRLEDAVLTTTSPDLIPAGEDTERFRALKARARLTRFGGDCYGYCLLAAGHVDLVVESGLKPYDVMALIPIIERAGGRITTWTGEPATSGGRIVAAGDPALHEAALKILSR
jgi:myo-inositol-1(or 4)-monophosphatase